MSTFQRLTLIGLYNYDSTIFDQLTLPDGFVKADFVNILLLEHGEKCVLYTNPNFLKQAMGVWSKKWALELTRIYEALTAEYNPIWNYDRNEEWEDHSGRKWGEKTDADYNNSRTANLQDKRTANLEDKRTANLQDKTTYNSTDTTSQTIDATSEKQVAAFNSSTYEPSEKNIANSGSSNVAKTGDDTTNTTGTDTMSHTGTDTMNRTGTDKTNVKGTLEDKNGSETNNASHSGHLWGNIGVTTAASMVTEVVQQRLQYNLYATAAQLFANELLIGIY